MAPFLDQSIDLANNKAERPKLPKQPSSKEKSRQADQAATIPSDQSRPKTSTGLRGNSILQKDIAPSGASPGMLQQPSSNLPTKNNFSMPGAKTNSHLAASQPQGKPKSSELRAVERRSS